MVGGHLDSWNAGTGATDDATGVALAMEVARIFKTLKLEPRRTIRVALWSGEEQGLCGSKAYVAQHFAEYEKEIASGEGNSPSQRKLIYKPEYEKLSCYFNFDEGTGKIRGIMLEANEAVRRFSAAGSNRSAI